MHRSPEVKATVDRTSATAAVSPEPFAEAARSGLTALNVTALVVCSSVGAGLSLYADLVRGATPRAMGLVALLVWSISIVLALFLAGRGAGAASYGVLAAILRGARMVRSRPGFAAVVILLSLGVAFTAWSRAKSQQGGVLSAVLADIHRAATAAESADARTGRIQNDTQALREAITKPESPREALVRRGYTNKPEDVCRAISDGDVRAMTWFREAGMSAATVGVPLGGGQYATCIESALLKTGSTPTQAALNIMPLESADLRRLYVSQSFGAANEGNLKAPQLFAKLGGADVVDARLGSVRGTALMLAVWGNSTEAVKALLAQGADPNEGGRFDFIGSSLFTVSASPLGEALRLGHQEIASALRASGARQTLQRLPYFK